MRRARRAGASTAVLACAGAILAGCAVSGPGASTSAAPAAPGSAGAGTASVVAAGSGTPGGSAAPALPACVGGELPTIDPGTLTIGTANPAMPPWYIDSPASGQGLESAVGYAVAEVLGYDPNEVAWVTVDRAGAVAGTVTGFDLDLNQFTAPDAGTPSADYSTGYFSVTDSLVVRSGTPLPSAAADLKDLTIAAVTGSSGSSTVQRVAGSPPTGYPGEQQALADLRAGAVAGVVLATPVALEAVAADPTLDLVGELPADPTVQPQQFKALLPKGSELTGCVSAAFDRLRVEGTLDSLAGQWVDSLVPELP